MVKLFFISVTIMVLTLTMTTTNNAEKNNNQNKGYVPEDGFVPNEETAVKIAEAVWFPIYGEKINENKPFQAILVKGVWQVTGTIHTSKGGAPYAEIQKNDCKILIITHSK
ncbi:MAG: hypothetical protein J0L62_04840 [Bacteroidetes bacterium]|nr:hypothetical protein [Bacteroidota bacterium]